MSASDEKTTARCLILACGNTLRGDDGVGPWLAAWAEEQFAGDNRVRVIARQQWTPDLAAEVVEADAVLFVDCSIASEPGHVEMIAVEPAPAAAGIATHQTGAAELLAMGQELYGSLPRKALMLTVGAGSTELGEEFSPPVEESLPRACSLLQEAVEGLLTTLQTQSDYRA